jgi:hypothetical protein
MLSKLVKLKDIHRTNFYARAFTTTPIPIHCNFSHICSVHIEVFVPGYSSVSSFCTTFIQPRTVMKQRSPKTRSISSRNNFYPSRLTGFACNENRVALLQASDYFSKIDFWGFHNINALIVIVHQKEHLKQLALA